MADTSPPSAPPPGWYAESARAQRLRWWNGSEWTNHYQLVVQARALQPPPPDELGTPLDQDIEDDADLLAAPQSAAHPGPQPATEPPPLTRAERAARERAASVDTQMNPIVAVSTATMTDAAPAESAPRPNEWRAADLAPEPEPAAGTPVAARVFPEPAAAHISEVARSNADLDPILGRGDVDGRDRMPPPVTYNPQSAGTHRTSTTSMQGAAFAPLSSRNPATLASLILILIGVGGGATLYFWRFYWESTVTTIVVVAVVVALVGALALAITGVVVAIQTPTRKLGPIVALVASSVLFLVALSVVTWRMLELGPLPGVS